MATKINLVLYVLMFVCNLPSFCEAYKAGKKSRYFYGTVLIIFGISAILEAARLLSWLVV